jgi:threonine efflux protein
MNSVDLVPFAGFALFWSAQVALPGPNFVRVSTAALMNSRGLAIVTSAGTATGNAAWCLAAALGAALVAQSPVLGEALRLAGALYFAWYGARLIARAFGPARPITANSPLERRRAFGAGVTTALANPQTGVFLATTLPAMFPALTPAVILGATLTVALVNFAWYVVVVSLLAAPAPRAAYLRVRPALELAFGGILMIAAAKLVRAALWPTA